MSTLPLTPLARGPAPGAGGGAGATDDDGAEDDPLRRLLRPGLWLGIGFGGFFDGILLHQVLQWHHLLSKVGGAWASELHNQVLADGLFHALMYVVAAVGLFLAVRQRASLARPHGPRRFCAAFLIGFGLWHVADAFLSHWLFGLHRVRMDTAHPLAWDLGWLIVFGLLPIAAGWMLRQSNAPLRIGAPMLLVALTAAGAVLAGRPPPGGESRLVVLRESADPAAVFHALAASDARVVASDASGRVWQVAHTGPGDAWSLYRHGAAFVSGTLAPAGCAAWFPAAPSP